MKDEEKEISVARDNVEWGMRNIGKCVINWLRREARNLINSGKNKHWKVQNKGEIMDQDLIINLFPNYESLIKTEKIQFTQASSGR